MEISALLHIQDRADSMPKGRALTATNALMPIFKRGERQHRRKKIPKMTLKSEVNLHRPKDQHNLVDDGVNVLPLRRRGPALQAFVFGLSPVQLCERLSAKSRKER